MMETRWIKLKSTSKYILSLLTCLGCYACLSEIEFDLPPNTAENFVIVAKLTEAQIPAIEVKITGLSSFSGNELPITVDNAEVFLFDNNGNEKLIPSLGQGIYRTNIEDIAIEFGKQYMLEVRFENKVYNSSFETLFDVPEAIKITTQEVARLELNNANNLVDARYLQFYIDSPLKVQNQPTKSYLRWEFEGVFKFIETIEDVPFIPPPNKTCYYTQMLSNKNIAIYNGPESSKDILEGEFLLEEKLDYRFKSGFYMNVVQQSLSETAFNYWNQIRTITDLDGNFFDDPPGKIIGNFINVDDPEEEVFGFFYATASDTIRYKIPGGTYEVQGFCPVSAPPNDIDIDFLCWDCLRNPNSTIIKPSYWEE